MTILISTSGQLGPSLQQLRKKRGLSQAELGRRIGLSQERISRIERTPEKVTFDQILTVLMALGAELRLTDRTEPGALVQADVSEQVQAADVVDAAVTRERW